MLERQLSYEDRQALADRILTASAADKTMAQTMGGYALKVASERPPQEPVVMPLKVDLAH
jgi:hypothetical protein